MRALRPGALALGIAACGGPPTLGPVHFVRGDGPAARPMRLAAAPLGAPPAVVELPAPEGAAFPAPAGPPGAPSVLIGTREGPGGHEEQLLRVDSSGALLPLGPARPRLRAAAWAPDGRALVVEAALRGFSDIAVIDLGSGEQRPLTDLPEGAFTPSVSPQGLVAFVASTVGELDLYAVPLAGGELRPLLRAPGEDLNPTWSPDGRHLAWISGRGGVLGVSILQLADLSVRALYVPANQGAEVVPDQGLAWSPDGRRLALPVRAADRSCITIFDVQTGAQLRGPGKGGCPPGREEGVSWAPDGGLLLTARSLGEDSDIIAISGEGEGEWVVLGGPGIDWLPRWQIEG